MKVTWKLCVSGTVSSVMAAAMIIGSGAAASANVKPSVYEELAKLNPGTTAAEMKSGITSHAKSNNLSVTTLANQTLNEARKNAPTVTGVTSTGNLKTLSGGGDKNKITNLPNAKLGDIFWWDSTFDHVGIYVSKAKIVHAPGTGKKVKKQKAKDVPAPLKTHIMLVNTKNDGTTRIKKEKRQTAANFAKSKLGKAYNKNFAMNKKIHADKYNCSQLVWAAWKDSNNIDLDNGLGLGVYPNDIREDRRTYVYKTKL